MLTLLQINGGLVVLQLIEQSNSKKLSHYFCCGRKAAWLSNLVANSSFL